ncbi:MAG: hypothetical protein NC299_02820 [Lachnospiraceae bacterium]|nr:hypothetical protein [Ruminococcus sp.]MCM1274284.1 hypothetical protein [Lachnospiraceae bacterium]
MILKFPVLAGSDNRNILARQNPYCGEPENWFRTEHFRRNGLRFTTFDFFINWSDRTFRPVAWVKRIIAADRTSEPRGILNSIIACDGNELFEDTKNFCSANGIQLKYIIIPDIPTDSWADVENTVILFDPNSSEVSELSIIQLIDLIHSYKVRYENVHIGREGLRYSTSTLETFLSRPNDAIRYTGDAIFPGDADIILFDEDYRPRILIEVKKFDNGTQRRYGIPIEGETLSLHLGDRLKYAGLDILQRHFDCEFYMLFYPVNNAETVKLEKIERLKVRMNKLLRLPNIHSNESLREFQTGFFDFKNTLIANTASTNMKFYHTNYRCKYIPRDLTETVLFNSPREAEDMGYCLCRECRMRERQL